MVAVDVEVLQQLWWFVVGTQQVSSLFFGKEGVRFSESSTYQPLM
jgi:hypothetical protein